MINKEKREFAAWWVWILLLIVISSVTFFGLRMVGVFGVRAIFENSFQYSEARKTEIATYQAQLAEIESRLSEDLDGEVRANLEAQASSLRVQLRIARSRRQ